ncbi:MAG: hypothetical protein Q8L48_37695 [Archangium sp.]|nr:hypothetical protein [Archangium sp.]
MGRFCLLLLVGSTAASAQQSLAAYAAECDSRIGAAVPAFNCDNGTLIPTTNQVPAGAAYGTGSTCDFPDRLNGQCDPGSRILRLVSTANVDIVGLCRKKGNGAAYGDIAVIQTNKITGATCFYQMGPMSGLSAAVPAPGVIGRSNWNAPSVTASQKCGACHDNGPYIRSPYLTQPGVASSPNSLPGTGSTTYNRTSPYWFVGEAFAGWRLASVSVSGNVCTNCHRLSASAIQPIFGDDSGSARDLGIRSVAASEASKNPQSAASPVWMIPNVAPWPMGSSANIVAADAMKGCGNYAKDYLITGGVFPKTTLCSVSEYGPWLSLGAIIASPPAAATSIFGEVDVVMKGTDNAVWVQLIPGNFFLPTNQTPLVASGYIPLGKPGGLDVIFDPIIVSGTGGVDVIAVTVGGAIWDRRKTTNGVWQSWVQIGNGATLAKPAAVAWGDGRLDIVVRALDNSLYHTRRTASGFTGWAPMGGGTYDSPTLVAGAGTSLQVFIRGTDNGVYQNVWNDSTGWGGWVGWGGIITSAPYAVAQNGSVSVIVRNSIGGVHRLHNTSGSFAWQELPGAQITGDPMGVFFANQKLVVLARSSGTPAGTLNNLIKMNVTSSGLGPWIAMGGNLSLPPGATNRFEELLLFIKSTTDGGALAWSRRSP